MCNKTCNPIKKCIRIKNKIYDKTKHEDDQWSKKKREKNITWSVHYDFAFYF